MQILKPLEYELLNSGKLLELMCVINELILMFNVALEAAVNFVFFLYEMYVHENKQYERVFRESFLQEHNTIDIVQHLQFD